MMIDVALFTTASLLQPAHQGRQTSTFLVVRRGTFRQRATKYVSNPRVFCHATSAPSQRKCTFLYLLEQLALQMRHYNSFSKNYGFKLSLLSSLSLLLADGILMCALSTNYSLCRLCFWHFSPQPPDPTQNSTMRQFGMHLTCLRPTVTKKSRQ